MSAIDPATRLILDFIRGGVPDNPSGESAGNYNAYFGHAESDHDFSKDTLVDVYNWQSAMLRRDSRSTAVGAYQFLKRTLQGLQEKLKLSGNSTFFTPGLQDCLAVELLVDRGYADWWRGELSDEDFLHNLSMEWASLPDPQNAGRSHYDGDSAGNHASTTQAKALAMLQQARTLIPKPDPQPAPITQTSGLTAEELAALEAVGRAFDLVAALPPAHSADLPELVRDIHNIQNRVLARVALRRPQPQTKES
jgi:muramidase (phage lysozyme)